MSTASTDSEYLHISNKAVKLFFRQGVIASVFFMIPAIIVALLLKFPYLLVAWGLISIYLLFIRPGLEYRKWSYRISDRYVDIVHGIFFTTFTHIPVSRIQHLDISQGPVQKGLGLASIVIVTAGMAHKIQGMEWETAQHLLEDIRKRVYEVKI